jgi:DHA1 family tetracycline resistance protein-like MFS transporter
MKNKNAAIIFIFLTVLIDIIGMAIIIPVMPTLIEELIGGNVSEASHYGAWLMFGYAVMQFLFSPIMGGLSDKYGRRPILLLSLLGMCINYIILIYAPTYSWLLLGRFMSGISGASITTANAYIADVSAPEKRAQNFGLIGVAFGLGFIIGPIIGGLAADISSRMPFVVAASITFLNLLYGIFILPESLKAENRRAFSWKRSNPFSAILNLRRHPVVSKLSITLFCVYMASYAVQATWPYYTKYKFLWTEKTIGISLGVFGVLSMLVNGLLIRWTLKKIGNTKSIMIGIILYSIGLLLFAFANQGWMMYLICIPYCLGGIAGPSLQSIMSGKTPPNGQGELQGALTGIMSIAAIFGPLLMLNLFNHFSGENGYFEFPGMPYIAGFIFMIIAAIFVVPYLRTIRSEQEVEKGI